MRQIIWAFLTWVLFCGLAAADEPDRYRFVGGEWFDGEEFVERTMCVEGTVVRSVSGKGDPLVDFTQTRRIRSRVKQGHMLKLDQGKR